MTSNFAPVRSPILAALTTTASRNPSTSTAICRFRPLIFLPASNPRVLAVAGAGQIGAESRVLRRNGDRGNREERGDGRKREQAAPTPWAAAECLGQTAE